MDKKSSQDPMLKTLIRKYLNEDCFIQSEPKHKVFEFMFKVKYPKLQDEKGNQNGRIVGISKPKKKNYLEINNKIILNEDDLKMFQELEDNQKFIINKEIRYFLICQNLLQSINLDKNNLFFLDKLYFFNSDYPTMNELYHSILKVISSQFIVLDILDKHLGRLNNNKLNSDSKDSYFQ